MVVRVQAGVMAAVVNINEVLDGHVALEVECVDRMLLNAYVPSLQVGGQVVRFLTGHLGNPVPSPALFSQIGNRFIREVKAFADGSRMVMKSMSPTATVVDRVDHRFDRSAIRRRARNGSGRRCR